MTDQVDSPVEGLGSAIVGPTQAKIIELLTNDLNPQHLDVINESKSHNKGTESHFKIIIVSDIFEGI